MIRLSEAAQRDPSGGCDDVMEKPGRLAPLRFMFVKHVLGLH
jgi:hypothetical protein